MKLSNKIAVLFFLLALSLAAFAQGDSGEKAPAIVLKDLNGKTVKLADFKGKVVLLNFWATWCVPCGAEIPELVKWQEKYGSKGLQILGITYPPTNKLRTRNFARQNKINYPLLFGSKKTKALFDAGDVLPFSVVIDRNGIVKARIEGIIFDEEFDEKIKPLFDVKKADSGNLP